MAGPNLLPADPLRFSLAQVAKVEVRHLTTIGGWRRLIRLATLATAGLSGRELALADATDGTIKRRVTRRMILHQIENLQSETTQLQLRVSLFVNC
jgi:hypothetical protein